MHLDPYREPLLPGSEVSERGGGERMEEELELTSIDRAQLEEVSRKSVTVKPPDASSVCPVVSDDGLPVVRLALCARQWVQHESLIASKCLCACCRAGGVI